MSDPVKIEWIRRVLGFSVGGVAESKALALGRPEAEAVRMKAQQEWTARRAMVIGSLKQLEGAIRTMKDPQGDAAIILVRAIAANLTPSPANKQSVTDLRNYLRTDSIIDDAEMPNGFGITIKIRAPLLPALDALDRVLP